MRSFDTSYRNVFRMKNTSLQRDGNESYVWSLGDNLKCIRTALAEAQDAFVPIYPSGILTRLSALLRFLLLITGGFTEDIRAYIMKISQYLLFAVLLVLTSQNAADGRRSFDPCGKRCILDPSIGKWVCKRVVCPPCYACIYEETCRLRDLSFKCCARVGFCYRCPDCDCGRVRSSQLVQSITGGRNGGCSGDGCQLPTLEESAGSSSPV